MAFADGRAYDLIMAHLGWYQFKLFLEHASGISMDALHVLVGFCLFLLSAVVLRRAVTDMLPWLATLILECGNEAHDLMVELWPNMGSQLGEGAKDILLTMTLPTLLMMTARWKPQLLAAGTFDHRLADNQVPDRTEVLVAPGSSPGLEHERQ